MTISKALLGCISFIIFFLVGPHAVAAPTDAEANRKIDNAINTQYASADIDLAEKTLLGLINDCGSECSSSVVARAWMYVGIVRGSGRDDAAGARAAFTAAKAADPAVKLDDLFATDTVRKVFAETQAPADGETMPLMDDIRERAAEEESVSAIECSMKATAIETQRAVPFSCRAPSGTQSLVLFYRHEMTTHWREQTLTRSERSWVGEIPCSDTKQIGVMGYWIQALDGAGNPVDSLGSEEDPVEFGLVEQTSQAAPSLPGKKAPKSCRPVKKPEPKGPALGNYGETCTDTSQCSGGLTCTGGQCITNVTCDSDAECFSGTCEDGVCAVPSDEDCEDGEDGEKCERASRAPGNWFGIQGGIDFAMMSGDRVCGGGADAAFSCFEGGAPYRGLPNENFSGSINGGFRTATTRVMLSYERSLSSIMSLEGRFGFAFNGGPESPSANGGDGSTFLPLHAEGRVKLYFTRVYRDDGRGLSGPSGFVTMGGGLAQVDPKVTVPIAECRESPVDSEFITEGEESCILSGNRAIEVKDVDVYQRLGQGFVTAGVGLRWGFGKHVAAVAAVNAQVLLPSTGFTLSPSLGLLAGF